MERMSLAGAELSRHDWSALRCAGGPATDVPQELRGLLAATNGEERRKHYWKLDNNVVVQGNLYEAAVPVVSVLCAALADGNASPYAHSVSSSYYSSSCAVNRITVRSRRAGRTSTSVSKRLHYQPSGYSIASSLSDTLTWRT